MIITGSRSKKLIEKTLDGVISPFSKTGKVIMSGVQKYRHIFWVPLFPMGKEITAYCSDTDKIITLEDLSESGQETYKQTKASYKTSIFYYTGIAFFALFAVSMYFVIQDANKAQAEYYANPKVGDVYAMKNDSKDSKNAGYCAFYKITAITDESFEAISSTYEYSRCSGKKIRREKAEADFYNSQVLSISRADIAEIKKDGRLYGIAR